MTVVQDRPVGGDADAPRRTPLDRERLIEPAVAAIAGAFATWVPFHLEGWNAPFGFLVCWFLAASLVFGVIVYQRHGVIELKDRLATVLVVGGTSLALLPLFLVLSYTFLKGITSVVANFPHVLTHDMRGYKSTKPPSAGTLGLKGAIIGSVEQVLAATLATVPIGVLAATYINEVGGRFARVVQTVADAMTGLPSVIAGLFVYTFYIFPLHSTSHLTGFAVAMALSVVMLPTIVRTAEEVLRIVSDNLREAALALGAPEWRMILRVVIPTARTGLITAALLGVARAVGETAPVLLTDKVNDRVNANLFKTQQDDLPIRIYEFAKSQARNDHSAGWGAALILVTVVLTLFVLARILGTGGGGGGRLRRLTRPATVFASRVRAAGDGTQP